MHTVTVERLAADGPFKKGDRYEVAAGITDVHFDGVVSTVVPLDGKRVAITVELSDDDYARLLASKL